MVVEFTRHDIIKQFECHLEKAHQFFANKNFRDAVEEYFQALPLTQYNASITLGQIKYQIANCYYFLQDYRLAIKYYDQIISEYLDDLSRGDDLVIINRKAIALGKMGFYHEAIELLEKFAEIKDGNEAKLRAYINLGVLYFQLYKFTEGDYLGLALDYLKKGLLLINEGEKIRKHGILRNMGMIYHEQKKYLKALETFQNSLQLVTEPVHIAKTYSEMAKTHIALLDFKSANELLNQGQEILIRNKDFYGVSYSLMVRGMMYERKNDINNAHNYLQTAFFGFLEIQAFPEVVETCLLLYKLFSGVDQSRAEVYYEHYKFYINYVDPYGTC